MSLNSVTTMAVKHYWLHLLIHYKQKDTGAFQLVADLAEPACRHLGAELEPQVHHQVGVREKKKASQTSSLFTLVNSSLICIVD